MTPARRIVALTLTLASAGASVGAARAGWSDWAAQRFSSRAEVVRVDALVVDGRRSVRGLTASDFEVRDAGVVQRVQQVDIETLPLDVICGFDTSGSVEVMMKQLVESGLALLGALQPDDRAAVLAFANSVNLVAPLTSDRGATIAAIRRLTAEGRTMLRDGAFAGLALQEPGPRRTLLLLFSDGRDTGSWLTTRRVLDAAGRVDVVVYAVAVRRPGGGPPEVAFLKALAAETGGRVIVTDGSSDLRSAFTQIVSEFRERYVLSYVAEPPGVKGWHPLDVTLKGKSGKITARRGYFAD